MDKNRVFVFFAKKARAMPTPVANPANRVNPNAKRTLSDGILPSINISMSAYGIKAEIQQRYVEFTIKGCNFPMEMDQETP